MKGLKEIERVIGELSQMDELEFEKLCDALGSESENEIDNNDLTSVEPNTTESQQARSKCGAG